MRKGTVPLPFYRRAGPEPGLPAQGAAALFDQCGLLKHGESGPTRYPNQRRLVFRLGINARALLIHHLPRTMHAKHVAGAREMGGKWDSSFRPMFVE